MEFLQRGNLIAEILKMSIHLIIKFVKTNYLRIYNKRKTIVTILAIISIIVCIVVINDSRRSKTVYPMVESPPMYAMMFNTLSKHMDGKAAISLYRKIHILCAVIVQIGTPNIDTLYNTWLKHCNRVCCLTAHLVSNWDVVRLQRMHANDNPLRLALDYLGQQFDLSDIDWILVVKSNT